MSISQHDDWQNLFAETLRDRNYNKQEWLAGHIDALYEAIYGAIDTEKDLAFDSIKILVHIAWFIINHDTDRLPLWENVLQTALQRTSSSQGYHERPLVYWHLAEVSKRQSKLRTAINSYRFAVEYLQERTQKNYQHLPDILLLALAEYSQLFFADQTLKLDVNFVLSAQNAILQHQHSGDRRIVDATLDQAMAFASSVVGDTETCLDYGERSLALWDGDIDDEVLERGRTAFVMSTACLYDTHPEFEKEKFKQAEAYLKQAADDFEAVDYPKRHYLIPAQRGTIFWWKGPEYARKTLEEMSRAFREYMSLAEANSDFRDLRHEATAYHSLAIALLLNNKYDDAEMHFLRAQELWVEIGNKLESAGINNDLGCIALKRGQVGVARKFFEKARDEYAKLPDSKRKQVMEDILQKNMDRLP